MSNNFNWYINDKDEHLGYNLRNYRSYKLKNDEINIVTGMVTKCYQQNRGGVTYMFFFYFLDNTVF